MLKITLNDFKADQQLKQIAASLKNPEKMYGAIGETLKKIHRERFKQEISPDGKKWQKLSPVTQKIKQQQNKSPKILRQDGYFSDKLAYNYNQQGLEFGSDAKYAKLHQYGGVIQAKNRKSLKFGGTKSPHYAKKVSIPARPWLGINSENQELLLSKAKNILSSQIKQILR